MNDQQGKGKIDNELHNSLSDMTITEDKKINNPMISSDKVQASYSGDTKDLSALLSTNPNPAIKELLQQKVINKYGLGIKKDTEFVS